MAPGAERVRGAYRVVKTLYTARRGGGTPIMEVTRTYGSKDPILSALLSPNDSIFLLIVSAVTQRPHIFGELWALRSLSHKDPYFLHSAATGSYSLFQLYQQIDHFCHFRLFFFANSCFKSVQWKIKSNILSQCSLNLNHNLAFHPMTPHFLRLCSHRMAKLFVPPGQYSLFVH